MTGLFLSGAPAVEWDDGFEVVRITKLKKQIVFEVTWQGRTEQFCMGPRSLYVNGIRVPIKRKKKIEISR